MPRNMSFSLTADQIRTRTKTVLRASASTPMSRIFTIDMREIL